MSMRRSFSAPFVPPAPITSISHGGGITTNLRGLNIFNEAQAREFITTGRTPGSIQAERNAAKKAETDFFKKLQDQFAAQSTALNEQLTAQQQPQGSVASTPVFNIVESPQDTGMTPSEQNIQKTNILPLAILGIGALLILG